MGTISFTTDRTPGQLLRDELGGNIRMFTTSSDGAAAAVVIQLADLDEKAADMFRGVYDLPMNAEAVTLAVVVKGHGIGGRGPRSVSMKVMDELSGPYYTGGASVALLDVLTPLRPAEQVPLAYTELREWAAKWRDTARSNARNLLAVSVA